MKTLKEYINEGLLRGQQSTLDSSEEAVYVLIEEFLKENYDGKWIISEKPNKDGLYEVSSNGNISVITQMSMTSLTNGLFIWTNVKGYFRCNCFKLKSLEGAPKEVGGKFDCCNCRSIQTLEGAPEKVGLHFDCSNCKSLKSLKGAPKKVGGDFDCYFCEELKSLKGAPKEIGGDFTCNNCDSLTSLDGAPKKVGGDFVCSFCGKFFPKEYIEKEFKIKGNIRI